jgi:hypothetical protein
MVHLGLFSGAFINFLRDGALIEFYLNRVSAVGFNPRIFGALGYHLWFLGFLFMFSLVAIPIFKWLDGKSGSRFIQIFEKSVRTPFGIFIWVIPLAITQIIIRPSFPEEHEWADFFYQFLFFLYGYILFADKRFLRSFKRHWVIILIISFASSLLILSSVPASVTDPLSAPPSIVDLAVKWGVFSVNSWFWTILLLVFGMNYLDFHNAWLEYGKQAIMPFFLIHQPVIFVIAFYVVQWNASVTVKLLSVVGASFLVTLGLYELVIKRMSFLRSLMGTRKNRP